MKRVPESSTQASSRASSTTRALAVALAAIALALMLGPSLAAAAGTGAIAGTVSSAAGGDPIDGAEVCAYGPAEYEFAGCTSTNLGGEYELAGLEAGSYAVEFYSPSEDSYLTQYYDGKDYYEEADPVPVAEGTIHTGIDASLHRAGLIDGRVTSAETETPIEYASVCAYRAGSGEYAGCTSTDADGEYSLAGLENGNYKIQFSPPYGANYVRQYYDGKSSISAADPVSVAIDESADGIDAALVSGATIGGHITDAETEAPVPFANVCAYGPAEYEYAGCTSADSEGAYTLVGLEAGSYTVRFEPPYGGNYVRQYYDDKSTSNAANPISVAAGEAKTGIDAALQKGAKLIGTVTDAETEAPIESVYVCAIRAHGGENTCASTDSDGKYTLSSLEAATYLVHFEKPYGSDYLAQYYDGAESPGDAAEIGLGAGETRSEINAAFQHGGKIAGTVTSAAAGDPIEGAEACAYGPGTPYYGACAETDSSGNYTIGGLSPGFYRVHVSSPSGANYVGRYYDGKTTYLKADRVQVSAATTTAGADVALEDGGGIAGTVTDALSHEPVGYAEVCAFGAEDGNYDGCVYTDGDGEYSLSGLPGGSYKVRFSPGYEQNYAAQYFDGKSTFGAGASVTVSQGSTTGEIDAELQAGGEISGRVTGAPDEDPLEGIQVCASGTGNDEYRCVSTDESGEYAIEGLTDGSYTVEFYAIYSSSYVWQYYSGKASYAEADPVAVSAGENATGIDAELQLGGEISGTVTDATTSEPLSGAAACASPVGGYEFEYGTCAVTDADGNYTIHGLHSGSYKVRFSGGSGLNYITQYYDAKATSSEADPVSVSEGATHSGIDAALQPGGGVAGTVIDAATHEPLEYAQACAYRAVTDAYVGCSYTGADGDYSIAGLVSGSYKVEFFPASGSNLLSQYYSGESTYAAADPISVTAGSTHDGVDAALEEGGRISGTVTDAASSDPVADVIVCARPPGQEFGYQNCEPTQEAGTYVISGLPPGSYAVSFEAGNLCGGPEGCSHENYVRQYYNGESSGGEADSVGVSTGATHGGVDAAMQPGGEVRGHVTGADSGEPLEDAEVCAYLGPEEEAERCGATNVAGLYVLDGLPTDDYTIRFYPPSGSNYTGQYYEGKSSFAAADPVSVTAGAASTAVDAALEVGGEIRGHVTAAQGGSDLEGIEVCTYRSAAEGPEHCIETDASGNYRLRGLGAGSYQVEFSAGYVCGFEDCTAQDYARQFYSGKATRDSADPVEVTSGGTTEGVDAAMQTGGDISGRVTAAVGGAPVIGSEVCAYRLDEEDQAEACGETYENGEYLILGLSAGDHKVEFRPGFSCDFEVCTENEYEVQFYDGEPSMASADPVGVSAGADHESVDAALAASTGPKPVNTGLPQITGTPAPGETLSCSNGSWEHSPSGYARAWLRDGSPIEGQTNPNYTVVAADQGHSISCKVTATNAAGETSATSVALHVPAKPVNTSPPQLTGAPAVGETLTCSKGTWEHSPTGYSWIWLRGSTQIGAAAAETYEVQAADQGHSLACEVTAANADGEATAISNSLSVPAPAGAPVNTTPPSLTGAPALGESLSCSQGVWDNAPTDYAYSWLRDGSPIAGESESTYTVQSADAGHEIGCEVTASNGSGPASAASNFVEVPAKPLNTLPPQLTGTPAVGQKLSCSNGIWEHGPTSYTYAWLRDGDPIAGKTESSYVVAAPDQGHSLACRVTGGNGGGSASATSNALEIPAAADEAEEAGGGGSHPSGGASTPPPAATPQPPASPTPHPRPKRPKCRKGFHAKKVKGRFRCVKTKHHHKRKKRHHKRKRQHKRKHNTRTRTTRIQK